MKVLIIEDENSIREFEVAYLKQEGFETIEAKNGEEALQLFNKETVDLVLLDLNLPKINGLEVCKQIRSHSTVPIIMVTAKIEEIDELVGLEIGADDYIKKPFSPSILIARVKNILKRIGDTNIETKILSIDPEKMSVLVKGKKVELTTTEFNILYTLAKHPGKVFSRNTILDQSYDQSLPPDIFDRTVDAHVKNIRRKMKVEKNAPDFILTVIGKGYKFNDQIK